MAQPHRALRADAARNRGRILEVFEQYRPSIVFHAAALKHLPLLEAHPREGLLTNVFGTKNVQHVIAVSVATSRETAKVCTISVL